MGLRHLVVASCLFLQRAKLRLHVAITTAHFSLLLMRAPLVGAASLLKIQWGSFQADEELAVLAALEVLAAARLASLAPCCMHFI